MTGPLVLPAAVLSATLAAPTTGGNQLGLREALVIGDVGQAGRSAVHTDAVEAQLVAGAWIAPAEGTAVELPNGTSQSWQLAAAGDDGWLTHPALRGGYALWTVPCDEDRVMILHARGHGMVYVNGVPRAGDPYDYGFVRLPVSLRRGANELLFRVSRGRLQATLSEPRGAVYLDTADLTAGDLIAGEDWGVPGGVVIVNATGRPAAGLTITTGGSGLPAREAEVPVIPPMTVRKVAFWCGGPVDPGAVSCTVRLQLWRLDEGRPVLADKAAITLGVRQPTDRHRRTFISEADGSVQYYAVTPPAHAGVHHPALVLTLHGAGVEARRQAAVYRPRGWAVVVAPTNRRPYGFDWEDWGRLDALEVLADAGRRYGADPLRTYLTGHSMGGHGAWQLGVTFPDRFAAIGPSAGWVSFFSYGGAPRYEDPDPIETILARATDPSDTIELVRNTLGCGVYVLHGADDDNVPVEQARRMCAALAAFHPDLVCHEEPGAGHWWGDRCCDWPPMFEFFKAHARPAAGDVRHVEFITMNPGISASRDWVTIESQQVVLSPSRVVADRGGGRIMAATDNVAALRLDLAALPDDPLEVVIDGQVLPGIERPAGPPVLRLERADGTWAVATESASAGRKGPGRYGPFKEAFGHRMVFVYGTAGTPAENAWAFDKARYDAETFWYRGNGSVDLVADGDFQPRAYSDRNVILYGNADTNGAWDALLGGGPVDVRRGAVRIGQRSLAGDDLACLLIRPRPDSDVASVGVVAGTAEVGLRLTDRLPYFVSGVAYPDCTVIAPAMLTGGTAGVIAAGFFGPDWSVEHGDFAWRGE